MTIADMLARSDPARDLPAEATDPASPRAQAMLTRIAARAPGERRATRLPAHPRALRRIIVGGTLAGAAATVVLAAPIPWDHDGSGPVASAYAVTRDGGAVHVTVRWSELSDPDALQAHLDAAHAHVKILVRTETPSSSPCPAPANTAGYRSDAVQWTVPAHDTQESGFAVWPRNFPTGGTFVVSVVLAPAGTTGLSTFAPGRPQVEQVSSYMVIGPVPRCAS